LWVEIEAYMTEIANRIKELARKYGDETAENLSRLVRLHSMVFLPH
jgi:hypothetical protein